MDQNLSLHEIAGQLYSFLAARFPVCCFSDEFYYFPQALNSREDWSLWDDLSPDAVHDAVTHLKNFRLSLEGNKAVGEERCVENSRRLLIWHIEVLSEQLEEIKLHTTRPTFILTVATAGILEALQSENSHALEARLGSLPLFLQKAAECLCTVPDLFREAGMEMAMDLERWICGLGEVVNSPTHSALQRAVGSVQLFTEKLGQLTTVKKFCLEPDQLERIVQFHSGSGLTIKQALGELEDEERELGHLMKEEGQNLVGAHDNANLIYEKLDPIPVPPGGTIELLSAETMRLREHCQQLGVTAAEGSPEIQVQHLPESLSAVRSADSYNALPGTPYRGGIFYLYGGGGLGCTSGFVHPSYRMTAAHETFPGHHLLDTCRWNHPDPVRRPLEHPLFYEGWACFGEELMQRSGALDASYDRFILYWRRHRHAVRGKTDLLLHSGRIELAGAAELLVGAGFEKGRAAETARKYAIQPAYQMCYTIGRRKFHSLFRSKYGERIPDFMNSILAEGELLFQDLEHVLRQKLST
jgi:hypothetical protein